MNKMYESLEELMQKTIQRGKATLGVVGTKGNPAAGFGDDLERLEKLVVERIGKLKEAVRQSEASAAEEARRTEQLVESLRADAAALEVKVRESEETLVRKEAAGQSMEKNLTEKIARLESQLKDAEQVVREKESAIHLQDQTLNARIKDLESQLRANEKILAGRHAQISDLQAQLKTLTHGIQEMSSFFKHAESLAAVDGRGALQSDQTNGGAEKPPASRFGASAEAAVPREFFDDLTRELTEVLGPIASVVVRDHVASFGASMENFPRSRVPDLLQIISQEILDEDRKITFRERLSVTL